MWPSLAIILGIASSCLCLAFANDRRAAWERLRGKSQVVATDRGPIEYAEVGAGPPVLVVHGAGGGFDQGLEFGRALAERGFRVIAMSRFGYLRTPMPADASPEAQADAHLALMNALGIEHTVVLGASAGAPSVMQFALRHPHRCQALGTLVPIAFRPATTDSAIPLLSVAAQKLLLFLVGSDLVFWLASKLARNILIKTVLGTPPDMAGRADPNEQTRVDRLLRSIQPIGPRAAGIRNDAHIASSIARFELEKIAVPTLVLSVHDDLYGTFASAQYTAQHIPGARFVGYDTGGHIWVGHHKQVIAEVLSFIRSATGSDKTGLVR